MPGYFWKTAREPQMNADERRYIHPQITRTVIGVYYDVYNEMGGGFLESVYKEAMVIALAEAGLAAEREVPLKARFRARIVGEFKADLIVGGRVLVELKAVRALEPTHEAQVLNYLRCSVLEIGLLLNFGPRAQVRRLILSNSLKTSHSHRSICVNLRHLRSSNS
jgi:GxxExxY protein